jgi:hypothetical protein
MYRRFEDTIDKMVVLDRYTGNSGVEPDVVRKVKHSEGKPRFGGLWRLSHGNSKPILAYNLDKRVSKLRSGNKINKVEVQKTPQKQMNKSKVDLDYLSPKMDNLMGQSGYITIRNSSRKFRRRDISYESGVHNIYAPEYSSSSEEHSQSEISSSLEISFELNDSYEELRFENWLSMESKEGDKSIKVERFNRGQVEKRSPQPLFSVSPKKDEGIQGKIPLL